MTPKTQFPIRQANRTVTAFQSLSQHRLNRDTDWIWLGRDALAGSQHDHGNNNSNNNLSGPRLTTATTSLELSKHPSLSRSPLTPTIPLPATASVCDTNSNNTSCLVVTPTAHQKLSLVSGCHSGSLRVPLAQNTSVSACATCHYEVSRVNIDDDDNGDDVSVALSRNLLSNNATFKANLLVQKNARIRCNIQSLNSWINIVKRPRR